MLFRPGLIGLEKHTYDPFSLTPISAILEAHMSKLANLLRRIARSEPAPLGFAALAGRTKNPEMLIAVTIKDLDQAAAEAAAKGGADFLLLDGGDLNNDGERIQAITNDLQIPCGLRVSKAMPDAGATARAAGLDYLAIDGDDTPASALLEEDVGYVFAVDSDATDTFLRILESMPFDAVFTAGAEHPFTIRRQLELRRVSGFAHKPLILEGSDDLNSQDLECLRDSGVAALLLQGDNMPHRIGAARSAIEAMRPRRRRREERGGATPVLPAVGRGGEDEDEEE
jgi:hypothetical protein